MGNYTDRLKRALRGHHEQHGTLARCVRMSSQQYKFVEAAYGIDGRMDIDGLPIVRDDALPFGTYVID